MIKPKPLSWERGRLDRIGSDRMGWDGMGWEEIWKPIFKLVVVVVADDPQSLVILKFEIRHCVFDE